MKKIIRSIRRSIYSKLVLIIFGAWLLINVATISFFGHFMVDSRDKLLYNNAEIYASYLIDDLGFPPDLKKAAEFNRKSSIALHIKGKGVEWYSKGDKQFFTQAFEALQQERRFKHKHHRQYFELLRNGYTYRFSFNEEKYIFKKYGIFMFLLVSVVLLIAFLLFKKLFKPLYYLKKGMEKVTSGELDYRVKVTSKDEFGVLTETFNRMNDKISSLIKVKDQLLIDVSHELKSPLTRINLAAEFIDGEVKESIRDDVKQLKSIIDDIFKTFKTGYDSESLRLEELNLVYFFSSIRKKHRLSYERLSMSIDESLSIKVDRRLFEILINNLLTNALNYSTVSDEPIQIMAELVDTHIEIGIKDFGVGIPAEDIPFLFEPFYRVDKSRTRKSGGNGLGLSICKRIADMHGFDVVVSSQLDEWTEFRIIIIEQNLPVVIG